MFFHVGSIAHKTTKKFEFQINRVIIKQKNKEVTYEELGATFTDNYDTILNVVIAGDAVDTETEGTYVVNYNVTDSEGNIATQVTRTIIVESASSPVLVIILSVLSVSAISAGGAFLYIKKIKPGLKN